MTMYTLPNFCRVCLKYDKNLIDLAHIENEPNETLMSKLQQCVSEVEWTVFKPLLCHPCIKRLNIAHSFKKQCIHSAGVLKNYVELVKESQKKNESQNTIKAENVLASTGGTYMLLPNQKYVKILVGGQNQGANTFQNVFLNLIPASSLNPILTTASNTANSKSKDNNQNVFLNINNSIQKIVPVSQSPTDVLKKSSEVEKASVNVNQLLTESKSEELSVEIDPTVFGLEEGDEESEEEELNDYDEVISQAKITLKDIKGGNGEKVQNGKEDQKYYVPILPKTQDDFFSSGQHFLFSQSENSWAFVCEQCQKSFPTKKLLKAHINQFHLGKLPFKCEYCYLEFATRNEYELCLKTHKSETETLSKSLTLRDFSTSSLNDQLTELEANIEPTENGEYVCDVCRRPFSSSTGLLRHKVRKHNQKNKKKYFIKGMKNAKCDICNREFSTQSYMQLHKKLHMRDDFGYKYKVFGKSKYNVSNVAKEEKKSQDDSTNLQETLNTDDSNVENLDVTPDIFMDKSDDESNDEDREDSIEDAGEMKPEKMEVEEENASENETEEEELIDNHGESETINEKNCDVKEVNDN